MRDSKQNDLGGVAVHPRWRELNAFTWMEAGFDPQSQVGYSLAIKDNIEVAGMPCTCGTPGLRNYIPQVDASAVARLRAVGAAIVGKTNMHELAYGITSNNAAFGPVRNAFDATCIAGGSSGGTAVAIAAGVVRAGLGTDTGGSVRIPAALNGIVGFRPSIGRYPMDGVVRISPTRDVIGPMARDVADVAFLDAVLAGESPGWLDAMNIRGVRLGLPEEHFRESLHPDVHRTFERVIASLSEAGVIFVRADLQRIAALNAAVSFPIVLHETKTSLQRYLQAAGLPLSLQQLHEAIASPDVKELVGLALNDHVSPEAYRCALNIDRPRLQQLYSGYFAAHNVEAVLFPTTPLPACPIRGSDQTVSLNGTRVPTFATFIRNTDPASNAGVPSISIPAGFSSTDLPLGIELDGPTGGDRRLLALASAIEAVLNRHSASCEAAP